MKKDKLIAIRLENDIYDFLQKNSVKKRTSISHELRKILLKEMEGAGDEID